MSDIRRFEYLLSDTGVSLEEATEGRYVLFRDHEAARAEVLENARQWKARTHAAEENARQWKARAETAEKRYQDLDRTSEAELAATERERDEEFARAEAAEKRVKEMEQEFNEMTVQMRGVNIMRAMDACGEDCHLRKALEVDRLDAELGRDRT